MREAAGAPAVDLGLLRRNAEENYPLFCAAGLGEKDIRTLTCRRCGTAERAFFWTVARKSDGVLDLTCPVCRNWEVRYDLRRNDWQASSPWKPLVAAALVAGGAALYLGFREPVHDAVRDALQIVESRIDPGGESEAPETAITVDDPGGTPPGP
ncbi:MAG TPA: hypothetical protein VGR37_21040 [Longimicrobiaceae bacterium]|nr:hypothetical protein [Longimicrobiaceae bacterium]